jgi:chaperone required for assembly of F1-ATPase
MKRFWEIACTQAVDEGFVILLDKRRVSTPMRAELILPNHAMAQAVCDEWQAVGDKIDPAAMPVTGLANAATDRIGMDRDSFVGSIAAFGETDLFCYRADEPAELVARQAERWDRYLRWCELKYGAVFTAVTGIMHQPQPENTVLRLRQAVAELNIWQLAAASKMVPITGSLVALLALIENEVDAAALWPDLVLDELWQEEKWGADHFALKNRRDREADFMAAARFLELAR